MPDPITVPGPTVPGTTPPVVKPEETPKPGVKPATPPAVEPGTKPAVEAGKPEPGTPEKQVPYGALHEERERRKASDAKFEQIKALYGDKISVSVDY